MEKIKFIIDKNFAQLPKNSGVYFFYAKKELIYIGKAINIKNRVKNHFNQPSYRDNLFIDKVNKIGFTETNSEIEALILEANLIKKHQPKYNVMWRDDKNYFYVAITKTECPIVFITHQKTENAEYIGPFVEGNALKKALRFLRKAFPYYTTKKHPKLKCTYCHLGLCPGPNPDLIEYKKNIKKLSLILSGKKATVLSSLRKEMKEASKNNHFETAAKIRDRIFSLQQVMSHTSVIEQQKQESDGWQKTEKILQGILNADKNISKIECYDVSNIQGKHATSSMVVFVEGKADKSQYKKFKIRMQQEPNDIAMLKETLERRFLHEEWKYPEAILIDGGIAQLNVAIRAKDLNLKTRPIKVISIAKGKQELFIEGRKEPIPLKNLPQEIYNLIKNLDDEAHRFAITYHKTLRKKNLLK
jgi:excinuclease ABC subunit C